MKVFYEVYVPEPMHPHGGDFVSSYESLEEALEHRNICPEAIIIKQEYSDDELSQIEADSLPGVEGYYPY